MDDGQFLCGRDADHCGPYHLGVFMQLTVRSPDNNVSGRCKAREAGAQSP